MNLGLVHPYIYHLNSFILIMLLLGWLGSYIKRDSWVLNISLIITNYLGVSGAAILSSIIIIFLFSADYLLNLDLFFSLLMIGVYIYLSKIFITMFKEIFIIAGIKNLLIQKIPTIAIITPFIISFIIFYSLYYGDNIYKLSPHCENTEDPKIKVCQYSNGTYTGEMKAFRRHGQGEYIWNSGKTYNGKWIKGKEAG
tara:strand:+ start:317 stop:907 length:591 start_codon:yes stop_codon:yes gene_type:complete